NLARYREENTKIAPPAKDENRVVFMGDSITDFWAQPQMAPFFPGKPYIGRGISGQTTPQMLLRFRPDVIALPPKPAVILADTNDSAGNTGPMSREDVKGNLASMSEFARSHGTKVILSSVLPVYDGGHNRDGKEVIMTDRRLPEKILALNGWIKKYSADNNITNLNYSPPMVDEKGFLNRALSKDAPPQKKKGYDFMPPPAEAPIAAPLKK